MLLNFRGSSLRGFRVIGFILLLNCVIVFRLFLLTHVVIQFVVLTITLSDVFDVFLLE
jgi:hypothetical protein